MSYKLIPPTCFFFFPSCLPAKECQLNLDLQPPWHCCFSFTSITLFKNAENWMLCILSGIFPVSHSDGAAGKECHPSCTQTVGKIHSYRQSPCRRMCVIYVTEVISTTFPSEVWHSHWNGSSVAVTECNAFSAWFPKRHLLQARLWSVPFQKMTCICMFESHKTCQEQVWVIFHLK